MAHDSHEVERKAEEYRTEAASEEEGGVIYRLSESGVLTWKQAFVYVRSEHLDCPRRYIADSLDVSVNTVDTHLQAAKQNVESARATVEALDEVESGRAPVEALEEHE